MFTLIDLPYSSLSPVIGDETLSFHYGKHLQTYVDNLNKLVAGTGFEGMGLTDVILASAAGTDALPGPDGRGETGCGGALSSTGPCGNLSAIFNNAGQILNNRLRVSLQGALLLLHRHAGPVAHILIGAVRMLNRVVFPQLGLPARAILIFTDDSIPFPRSQ